MIKMKSTFNNINKDVNESRKEQEMVEMLENFVSPLDNYYLAYLDASYYEPAGDCTAPLATDSNVCWNFDDAFADEAWYERDLNRLEEDYLANPKEESYCSAYPMSYASSTDEFYAA